MASDYTYDESGQLWPYFVFTLSCIITLPLTYVLTTSGRDTAALFPRIKTDYRPEHAELVEAQRAKDKRKQRRLGLAVAVVVGWAIMAYMMYLIQTTEVPAAQKLWNPYDILGISEVCLLKVLLEPCRRVVKDFSRGPPAPHSEAESGGS